MYEIRTISEVPAIVYHWDSLIHHRFYVSCPTARAWLCDRQLVGCGMDTNANATRGGEDQLQ